jgi:ferredoxin
MVVMCVNKDKGAVARKACTNACIGCSKCQKVCEFDAITIENNLAYIDYNKCRLCRKCEDQCPTGAIHAVNFPPRKAKAAEQPVQKVQAAPKVPVQEGSGVQENAEVKANVEPKNEEAKA